MNESTAFRKVDTCDKIQPSIRAWSHNSSEQGIDPSYYRWHTIYTLSTLALALDSEVPPSASTDKLEGNQSGRAPTKESVPWAPATSSGCWTNSSGSPKYWPFTGPSSSIFHTAEGLSPTLRSTQLAWLLISSSNWRSNQGHVFLHFWNPLRYCVRPQLDPI